MKETPKGGNPTDKSTQKREYAKTGKYSSIRLKKEQRLEEISKIEKPVLVVRKTEYEVDGRTVFRTDSMSISKTVWRDSQGRFLSINKIKAIKNAIK